MNKFNILTPYVDACLSGTTTKNRTSFQQMLNDIKTNEIHAIVVYKLSRISRNMQDLVNIVNFLKECNVHLISIEDNIDTSTPMGMTFLYLIGAFAEMDRENIISNCKRV
ncbi:recombinase family protein [Clostridium butyricum]|uniref:recombinase family protein n=1 Tax=Clostridium butyricum TaxID=1492 RepID=UPI0024B3A2D1|nr:recombinase family protein [Clostridium butyricum]MDI9210504.1 recombinase family protein [Clostridium butyricum]